ncbi:1-phosphatidylinositol phosphodiesterase [Microdochium nivale]|nr:1-phosphatidylinositol phosphodiesterase [Microdochium nivale]
MRGSRLHSLLALAAIAFLSYTDSAAATTLGGSSSSSNKKDVRIPRQAAAQRACNGAPELCGRTYDAITHMGAHNSAFVRDASTNNSIAANQYFPAARALDDGLRLLQAQTHGLSDGTIELCHGSCALLDAGPLAAWLRGIRAWLEGNPDEVVTLLLVNGGRQDAAAFGRVFEAAGLAKYGFVPARSGGGAGDENRWPTLQSMIAANTRLVVFITSITTDYSGGGGGRYPYLLPQFDHVFETHWAVTSAAGFNCTLDRPGVSSSTAWASSPAAALAAGKLSLMNHFRYNTIDGGASLGTIMFPAVEDVAVTNSPEAGTGVGGGGTLGAHAERCVGEWGGSRPTFVLVDFYSEGPAMATADRLNGVSRASAGAGAGDAGSPSSPRPATTTATLTTASKVTGNSGGGTTTGTGRDNGVVFGLVVFIVGALVMI